MQIPLHPTHILHHHYVLAHVRVSVHVRVKRKGKHIINIIKTYTANIGIIFDT